MSGKLETITGDLWTSSDHHFFHGNIVKKLGAGRPFADLDEMHYQMIKNWNEEVPPDGRVIYDGDFSFGQFTKTQALIPRLNGKIDFILGNHDPHINEPGIKELFPSVQHYKEIWYHDQRPSGKKWHICFFHFPIKSWHWMGRGSIMLHGHSHSRVMIGDPKVRRFDVGVDANDYRPVHIYKIIDAAEKIDFKAGLGRNQYGAKEGEDV